MATLADEGTVAIAHETDDSTVIGLIMQLREVLQGHEQIVGSSFIENVADVADNVVQLMNEGNRPNNIEILNAYSCVASCFAMVKSSVHYVQDLERHVDQQEHNARFKRIQNVIRNVTAELEEVEKHIKELGNLAKKISEKEYSKAGDSMMFDTIFDQTIDALAFCSSGLGYAKKELENAFASLKSYSESCPSRAVVSVAVTVADIAKALVSIIGTSISYGVNPVAQVLKIGALGYISYKLWNDCNYRDIMKAQYEECISEIEDLERRMGLYTDNLNTGSIGNANRVKSLTAEIEALKEENARLKGGN